MQKCIKQLEKEWYKNSSKEQRKGVCNNGRIEAGKKVCK